MPVILVTGGAGFIGSHVCDALLARGDEVVCIDNLDQYYDLSWKMSNISANWKNPKFHFYIADASDKAKLSEIFDKHKIGKILHLAGKAGVRDSVKRPGEYVKSNVLATTYILELALEHGIRDIVVASSSSVYGVREHAAFVEEESTDFPISPYGATKKACEPICYSFSHMTDLNITLLRYFTVYGPRNRPDMAMFLFAKWIMDGKEIPVFGEDTKRDWTYVGDIVEGTIMALDKAHKYAIMNLGSGNSVPIRYVIGLLEKELGRKAITRVVPLPAGDVPTTFADASKAQRLLGWKAKTPIEDGVKRFVEWFNRAAVR